MINTHSIGLLNGLTAGKVREIIAQELGEERVGEGMANFQRSVLDWIDHLPDGPAIDGDSERLVSFLMGRSRFNGSWTV